MEVKLELASFFSCVLKWVYKIPADLQRDTKWQQGNYKCFVFMSVWMSYTCEGLFIFIPTLSFLPTVLDQWVHQLSGHRRVSLRDWDLWKRLRLPRNMTPRRLGQPPEGGVTDGMLLFHWITKQLNTSLRWIDILIDMFLCVQSLPMADTRTHSQGSLRLHQVMQPNSARPLSSSKYVIFGIYMHRITASMYTQQ